MEAEKVLSGVSNAIVESEIVRSLLLLSVGCCCLMNLCPENGIYLGTRGAAAALQCFLVPLKSPELAKASWAAAQRILITNGSKLLGTVCCFQNDGGWSGKGEESRHAILFCTSHLVPSPPCYLLPDHPSASPTTVSLDSASQFRAGLFLEGSVCFTTIA